MWAVRGMIGNWFASLIGPIGSLGLLVRWHERRFARRASLEILDAYRRERAAHPSTSGNEMYARVAARRLGTDIDTAHAVVKQAEESFAYWPVGRDVKFCDVVTYLIISEYLKSKPSGHGTTHIRRVVARIVPDDL
jgi:hypothetical protein